MTPLCSIIIPYNRPRQWLDAAIASASSQPNTEVIQSQHDAPVGYNINRGIEIAQGEFIKYLCDDDLLPEDSIHHSLATIRKGEGTSSSIDFIHGNADNFFPDGRRQLYMPQITHPTLSDLLASPLIHGGTLMYRRSLFQRFGMFDEQLQSAEEYEFNLRLLARGCKIGYCDHVIYHYRRHDGQKSLGVGVNQLHRSNVIEAIRNRYR